MPDVAFEVFSDMKLRVVNIPLVMAYRPLGGLFGTNRIGPAESHHTRTDGDAKPPRFGFDAATPRARGPRRCRFTQCRGCGDHFGRREPQPQSIDSTQLAGRDPVADRLADIFGTYNKPAGRGRVEAGCFCGRTADRCRSPALRPGGLGRSRPPVDRGTRRTAPWYRAIRCKSRAANRRRRRAD